MITAIWATDGHDRMVAHASVYDGALDQVTAVLSNNKEKCNAKERHKCHKTATIISTHATNSGDLDDRDEDANNNAEANDNSGYKEEELLQMQPLTPVKWLPLGEKKTKRVMK
jgi:hypothetical protein